MFGNPGIGRGKPRTTENESGGVFSRVVEVSNKNGIHPRPATKIVEAAKGFKSKISIFKEDNDNGADAKSILGLLLLEAQPGQRLAVEARGEDAEKAVSAIAALIEGGFPESEEKI